MKIVSGFIFLGCFLPVASYSQCCSTGCSMSGTKSFGVNEKNHFQVSSFFTYNYSNSYFNGDALANASNNPNPLVANSSYNYSGLDISYGITSKLTVEVQTGYYIGKTQNFNPELPIPIYQLTGHGMADLTLLGKYGIISADSVLNIIFSGGIKLPTGTYREYFNDVLLPIDVQSGTGAYAGVAGITAMIKPYKKKNFRLILNRKEVLEGFNPDGYKYGFATTNSISTSFKIFKSFSGLIMLQDINRARDYDETKTPPDSPTVDASGYIKVAVVPGIMEDFGKEWSLGAYLNYPFYQKYNGIQLGYKYEVSATLTKTFGLRKEKS